MVQRQRAAGSSSAGSRGALLACQRPRSRSSTPRPRHIRRLLIRLLAALAVVPAADWLLLLVVARLVVVGLVGGADAFFALPDLKGSCARLVFSRQICMLGMGKKDVKINIKRRVTECLPLSGP